MVQNHLSRLAAPRSWPILRKTRKWVVRPLPSGHPFYHSFPLALVLRDLLGYAKTLQEVKHIIHSHLVQVNYSPCEELRKGLGPMDIVSFPSLQEHHLLLYSPLGKFMTLPLHPSSSLLGKIVSKAPVRGGKLQVGLHNGHTFLLDSFGGNVGDTVVFDSQSHTIREVLPLHKGASIYLVGGSHVGLLGTLEEIVPGTATRPSLARFLYNGTLCETRLSHVFVVSLDYAHVIARGAS